MKTILVIGLTCLLLIPAALCQQPAKQQPTERVDVVGEMLKRSRLLEDVRVEVPVTVWREYLRRQAGYRPPVEPAPVGLIAELGRYSVEVGEGGEAELQVSVRLRVFNAAVCRNRPAISARRAWKDVTVNGDIAKLATIGGWLRFSAAEPGEYTISARCPLPAAPPGSTSALDLPIPQTVRTLVQFDSDAAWQVTVLDAPRALTGAADGGTHGQLAVPTGRPLKISYGPVRPERDRTAQYRINGHVAWNLDAGRQEGAACGCMNLAWELSLTCKSHRRLRTFLHESEDGDDESWLN